MVKNKPHRVLGIDPGLASTGVAVLEREAIGEPIYLVGMEVIKTKPAKKKSKLRLRVTAEDQRRYEEIYTRMAQILKKYRPTGLGVEIYIFNPKLKGSIQSLKTLGVYVGLLWWGFTNNMFTCGFLPQDLKKGICGKTSSTKKEVERALTHKVRGFSETIGSFPETQREHLADATGHGWLLFQEIDLVSRMLGVRS